VRCNPSRLERKSIVNPTSKPTVKPSLGKVRQVKPTSRTFYENYEAPYKPVQGASPEEDSEFLDLIANEHLTERNASPTAKIGKYYRKQITLGHP
jgi:hypothetical protein